MRRRLDSSDSEGKRGGRSRKCDNEHLDSVKGEEFDWLRDF